MTGDPARNPAHGRRLRLRAAAGADRAASGARAHREPAAAARAGRAVGSRRLRPAAVAAPPATCWCSTTRASSRRASLGAKDRAARSRCWSNACSERAATGTKRSRRSGRATRRAGTRLRLADAIEAEVIARDDDLFRLRFAGTRRCTTARAPRPGAAAALHRACRRRPTTRPLPDGLSRAPRRGRRADRRAAFRRGAAASDSRRAASSSHRHAARRRRHVPAGAQPTTSPSTACTASATRSRRRPSRRSRRARARGGRVVAVGTTSAARARSRRHATAVSPPAAARPSSSSRPASASRSSTAWSPTSTCRGRRC